MKTVFFSILFLAGISLTGCSTGRESQAEADTMTVDTAATPPGNVIDSAKADSMHRDTATVKRDSM